MIEFKLTDLKLNRLYKPSTTRYSNAKDSDMPLAQNNGFNLCPEPTRFSAV